MTAHSEIRHASDSKKSPQYRTSDILKSFTPENRKIILQNLRRIEALGSLIGGDGKLKIELNLPNGGWHYDFNSNTIRVDPVDLINLTESEIKFIMAHEGGHRRISILLPESYRPSDPKYASMYQILWNVNEDGRVNNFVADSYVGIAEGMRSSYGRQYDDGITFFENLAKKRKFEQYCFLLLYVWYRERFELPSTISENLDSDVRKAFDNTIDYCRELWWTYPTIAETYEKGNIEAYQDEFFRTMIEKVWPEYKILCDLDFEDIYKEEEKKKKKKPPEEKPPEGPPPEGPPPEGPQPEGPPPEGPQPEGPQPEGPQPEGPQPEGPQPQGPQKPGQPKDKPEGQPPEGPQPQGPQKPGQPKDKPEGQPPEGPQPQGPEQPPEGPEPQGPTRELTEKEKEELRKKVQEILDEAVKKALEETPGSKIKETPKTEGEERYERDQADYTEDVEQPKSPTEGLSDEAIREFRKQLERETQKLTQTDDEGYDYFISRRSELAPLITRLEETLRAIFYRRKNSKYQRGKEGNRINIETRIQERAQKISVADSRAWERKEAPAEKDYAITLLIDLSGSMSVNIEDTIDALIVLAEALNQLGIKIEILGFNNEIFEFKNFDEVLNKDVRSRFHRAIEEVNYSYRAAYNDDGWAVLTSNERLIKRKESEKIMIVLSDGEPFPSTMHSGPEYELRRCIQSILSSGQLATLIGLGIGPGTQHVSRYYPNSRQQIRVQDLPKELSDVLVAAIDK